MTGMQGSQGKQGKQGNNRRRRRALMLGAVGVMLLPQIGQAGAGRRETAEASGDRLNKAEIPTGRISLVSFGGVPSASPAALKRAFAQAFDMLKTGGGGTLLVPPGTYDFGSYAQSDMIVRADNLSNIAISAYGATFKATTTEKVMPFLFYFVNPHNVIVAGARFTDPGFDPSVNWKGMYGVGIQANRPSRHFVMQDCKADKVIGLFCSNNNSSTRHLLEDIRIHGEVRNAYYGVGASYIRGQVRVDLRCHNVRRAFIAYALKDAVINVAADSTPDCLGSNGLVALVSIGGDTDNVENVRVNVNATGAGVYGSYVHFYHQGPVADGYMRNIEATVNLSNVHSSYSLFMFDHETNGVQRTTRRVWDKIYLHGSVNGDFNGRVIANPSVSTEPSRVYADRNLAALANLSRLPAYFRAETR